MFCNQCEQTTPNGGCVTRGVCGKNADVAALQDLLMFALKGLSIRGLAADEEGTLTDEVRLFIARALFVTLTNVNFDPEQIMWHIEETVRLRDNLASSLLDPSTYEPAAYLVPAPDLESMVEQGTAIGLPFLAEVNPEMRCLQELVLYGIRGIAAYAYHAAILGEEDDRVYRFLMTALADLGNGDLEMDAWLGLTLKCGEINLLAMELLDAANTDAFGHPVPTPVPLGVREGKCILVSGHDLKDLKDLLEATAGTGINIYTHGEMLPAHGYPEIKKHPHLVGNYGSAWQNQKMEFAAFPGPILMTTNCIQEPAASYKANIFTTGPVGYPGVKHLPNGQFQALIDTSLAMPGFTADVNYGEVMVGFARNTIMNVADTLIGAIKAGALKHIFLVGGCDGAKSGRNYYTEFVEKTPSDTAILTLGCGKYRFYDQKLGDIGGIPRLLDMGQCNDAYSAIQVAIALAKALDCEVGDLPLSMVLSWYEQKAVSILLTLLYLDIKNIRLGPSLPAFVSPGILDFLVENYGIAPIGTVDEDLAAILQ